MMQQASQVPHCMHPTLLQGIYHCAAASSLTGWHAAFNPYAIAPFRGLAPDRFAGGLLVLACFAPHGLTSDSSLLMRCSK